MTQQATGRWYFAQGSDKSGPHSFEQLQQFAAAGTVTRATLIWTDGMPQWAAAGTVAELFPGAAPPPVPAMPIGYAQPYAAPPQQFDTTTRMLIPVGRSGWAIAAGYMGLFAVLVIFAPISLVLGIVALIHLKRRPDLHGKGRAIFGIVMGGLFSILFVFMVIALVLGK